MRKIKLTVIIVVIVISSGLLWNFTNSYDFAASTTENPFGIEATLAYVKDLKISCPIHPCGPVNSFMFKYISNEPVQLISYNICGGFTCIKRDGFGSYEPAHPELSEHPEKWGGSTVGEIPWKVGDTIHIRVKVKPVDVMENGTVVYEDKIFFIDLGQSKIPEFYD
ncbi:MAG: hypothetical protein ABI337_03865 [Nitrososphaera sp.]|jgi:hypothetical protein